MLYHFAILAVNLKILGIRFSITDLLGIGGDRSLDYDELWGYAGWIEDGYASWALVKCRLLELIKYLLPLHNTIFLLRFM